MRYYLTILLLNSTLIVSAQGDSMHIDRGKWQKLISVTGYSGSVFVHTQTVKNVEGAKPAGFSVEFSKQMNDQGTFDLSSAYPRKGLSLSYFDFGTPILGHGFMADYFLQPTYRVTNHLQFYFRGAIGAAYLSDPYDAIKNPGNRNYSTYFNPYLHLGVGLGYRVTNKINMELATGFHHISNGNFQQPNAGLNWTASSLSISYYPGNNELPVYLVRRDKSWKTRKATVDIGFMYVPAQGYNSKLLGKRNFAAGVFAQIAKQVGRNSALSLGVEVYHNDITDGVNAPPGNNDPSLLAGIHAGHEFLLGRIIFSQQLGIYLTKHPAFFTDVYHRWGLRYKLDKHWQAGFNLKVHSDEADFVDLRILYRL